MDVPKDLGQRIVEAVRLAVALHLQNSNANFGGAIFSIGGADRRGGAVMDGGTFATPSPATFPCAGDLAESEAA
ncbi:MAG: hypothetical protein ABSB42_01005 [Tepidisphaeraceae bacterium]|jgi:hypothetical protein